MTTSFPTDKTQPFVADNGVTYYWDSDRWRVKTYKKEDDERLPYRLGTDKAARNGEAAVELVDNQDNYSNVKFFGEKGISCSSNIQGILVSGDNLQDQIDELGVTKGKVARYTTENTAGTPVARPGQLSVNTTYPPNVILVSFGIEDSDGVLTKPMADGDIIEFVDASSSKVSRYQITDATAAPTAISVTYISGNNDFLRDEEEQVYIYPQNATGASKEYVDEQDALKLNLTGGAVTGPITFAGSIDLPETLANKEYVDSVAGGVPIGTVVMWFGATAPVGWLICDGKSFSTSTYPALHAHLQTVPNYSSGRTPDFTGLYPGGAGSAHGNSLTDGGKATTNKYHSQRTAIPNTGAPYSTSTFNNAPSKTANKAGGSDFADYRVSQVTISEGWDNVTRPPTLSIYFIIKA